MLDWSTPFSAADPCATDFTSIAVFFSGIYASAMENRPVSTLLSRFSNKQVQPTVFSMWHPSIKDARDSEISIDDWVMILT